MTDDLSTKNLIGRTERNPWSVLLTSRPENYQIPGIGHTLIEAVDQALFERKIHTALTAGIILEKWAEHDLHFNAQAPAVLASIYSVCLLRSEAERQISLAKKNLKKKCADCKAQYHKRVGTFLIYESEHKKAYHSYSKSAELFLSFDNHKEAGKSILNRGVSLYMMHRYDEALRDEEYALELLGDEFSIHMIAASVNIAAILVELGRIDEAVKKIEEVQGLLKGTIDLERPSLILRWIRAQLLALQGDLKSAGEIIDRIERRMRRLDMNPELKVLLADRARFARRPGTIKRIARKAYAIEDIPRLMAVIEAVIDDPSQENVIIWRNELDAYVPPFPATV